MITHEENDFLCRVEGDAPMGHNLRRYWWPVLLSEELPERGRASAPRQMRLLGEDMVAFRGEDGIVRIVGARCPHRGASMALGVVDDCGLRCLFHGWKIDGEGTVVDAPNVEGAGERGLPGIVAPAYLVREAGDIIWAYAGPAGEEPDFPDYRFAALPARNRWVSLQIVDANYVQVAEGSLDPAHLAVLHQDSMNKASVAVDPATTASVRSSLAPRITLERCDFGFRLLSVRRVDEKTERVRPTLYVAPTSIFIPRSPRQSAGGFIIVTPIDDYRSLQMLVMWDEEEEIGIEPTRSAMLEYFGVQEDVLAAFGLTRATCDSAGKPARLNNFHQDRGAIANGDTFTGLPDFVPEDMAMAMSQGAITDRTTEHLVKSDIGVVELRRSLIASAKSVAAGGPAVGQALPIEWKSVVAYEYERSTKNTSAGALAEAV